jgi:hypothetical protein
MAIQFPAGYGVEAPPPVAAGGNSTQGQTPVPWAPAAPAAGTEAVADSLVLHGAEVAALELDILSHWDGHLDNGSAHAVGAAEFQMAREAAQSGDQVSTLQHLERAILADPLHADAARQDPAFSAMRGTVQELVGRLGVLAHIRAEALIDSATSAFESARATGSGNLALARAHIDIAQAHFELGSYAGFVEAAQAAARAQQLVENRRIETRAKPPATGARRGIPLQPKRSPVRHAVRSLWDRLPLLAILLGWFLAGVAAGVAGLPFQDGVPSEPRQMMFSIWALGLLAMVLLGFVRSILRLRRDRLPE